MKISHKLTISFLLVASLTGVTTYFALHSFGKIDRSFESLIENPVKMTAVLNEVKHAGLQIVSSTSEFAFIQAEGSDTENENDEEDQLIGSGHAAFGNAMITYESLVRKAKPEELATLEKIRESGIRLIDISTAIIDLKKANVRGSAVLKKREEFEAEERMFMELVDAALASEMAEQLREQASVRAEIVLATTETLTATVLAFLLAISASLFISHRISRRLNKIISAAERVGNGDLETRLDDDRKDDLGKLSRSFNQMIGGLRTSRENVAVLTREIADERQRFRTTLDNVPCVVWEVPLDPECPAAPVPFVSAHIQKMHGYSPDEWLSTSDFWSSTVHPEDRDMIRYGHEQLGAKGEATIQSRWITKEEQVIWGETRMAMIKDGNGQPVGFRGVTVDITERKSLEGQLTHQALHDPLTGLANRVLFRDRVEHALTRSKRLRRPIAVMFIDLDNFKSVNDTLGHAAGDELLVSVTERLLACLRSSDTPARFGGDEFAVLVEETDHTDGAVMIAERIRAVLAEPYRIHGREVFIGSSIGIAISAGPDSPEELLRNADVAMYRSKSAGRNRCTVYDSGMHDSIVKRVKIESDLRSALDRGEIEVYYQPIVDLETEKIMGMEALSRWNHSQHGVISPLDFIPVAEESGLIVPIGAWVLERACMQASQWQTDFGYDDELSITVNISSRQFQEGDLYETVRAALERSGLPPRSLTLEITESTMLINTDETIEKLRRLKGLGIGFAVDDFGTGYSSLSYLQRFPIDILKIDKSFIDQIANGKQGSAVAKAIITMGETLDLKTIAEGIEHPGQSVELRQLGCMFGQGYHFAKPLTAEAMETFLAKSSRVTPSIAFRPRVQRPIAQLMAS